MNGPVQVVVLSGKGGTGKTSVTAALAHLAATGDQPRRAVLADVDVDASNLDLVLDPVVEETHEFSAGRVAVIDPLLCGACGTCFQVCRFDAVLVPQSSNHAESGYTIDPIACDGCAACVYQCPDEAIAMEPQVSGQWFRSRTRFGPLVHASLRPAQEGSGKLVTIVREEARQAAVDGDFELVLLDGPPGIGCPAISAVTGTDLALIVTEPAVAAIHDLKRVLRICEHFDLPSRVCINKADLNPSYAAEIEHHCKLHGADVIGHIPFDLAVADAMARGLPVTHHRPESPAARGLCQLWRAMCRTIAEIKAGGA